MNSRFEDVFTPDRLRQNWHPSQQANEATIHNHFNQQVQDKFNELLHLIARQYPDISRLQLSIDTLTELIQLSYPLDTADASPAPIETLISQLEELEENLWVLGLASNHK
jgi:hypothetical protein